MTMEYKITSYIEIIIREQTKYRSESKTRLIPNPYLDISVDFRLTYSSAWNLLFCSSIFFCS